MAQKNTVSEGHQGISGGHRVVGGFGTVAAAALLAAAAVGCSSQDCRTIEDGTIGTGYCPKPEPIDIPQGEPAPTPPPPVILPPSFIQGDMSFLGTFEIGAIRRSLYNDTTLTTIIEAVRFATNNASGFLTHDDIPAALTAAQNETTTSAAHQKLVQTLKAYALFFNNQALTPANFNTVTIDPKALKDLGINHRSVSVPVTSTLPLTKNVIVVSPARDDVKNNYSSMLAETGVGGEPALAEQERLGFYYLSGIVKGLDPVAQNDMAQLVANLKADMKTLHAYKTFSGFKEIGAPWDFDPSETGTKTAGVTGEFLRMRTLAAVLGPRFATGYLADEAYEHALAAAREIDPKVDPSTVTFSDENINAVLPRVWADLKAFHNYVSMKLVSALNPEKVHNPQERTNTAGEMATDCAKPTSVVRQEAGAGACDVAQSVTNAKKGVTYQSGGRPIGSYGVIYPFGTSVP